MRFESFSDAHKKKFLLDSEEFWDLVWGRLRHANRKLAKPFHIVHVVNVNALLHTTIFPDDHVTQIVTHFNAHINWSNLMTTQIAERRLHRSRSIVMNGIAALVLGLILAASTAPCFADDAPKPDPAGIATGDRSSATDAAGNSFVVTEPTDKTSPDYAKNKKEFDDYQALAAKEPLAVKLADDVGHLRIGTNFAWTLNTGYLVLFMQAGFALLTCGLVRKKNAAHLMMLNFAAYVFAFLAYYAVGYAFQFGGVAINASPATLGGIPGLNQFLLGHGQWGFLGGKGFFLVGPAYDASSNVFALFEIVFMETAGYIIVGAVCERITFGAFLLCELFIGAILYPVYGCWVWGGGWLSQIGSTMNLGHGYVDFAGSSVVHAVGGFCAMALAIILGPRLGKYGPGGRIRVFPAHNLVYVVTGTLILLFGWMGFNPGSTLGRHRPSHFCNCNQYKSSRGRRSSMPRWCCGTSCLANPMSRWPATACWPDSLL